MKNEDEVAMIERSLAVFSFFCARVLSGLLFQVCSHGWREPSKISHRLRDETQNPARKKGKRSLALSLSRLQWDRGSRERETRISLVQSIPWTATLSAFFAAPRACSLVLKRKSSL